MTDHELPGIISGTDTAERFTVAPFVPPIPPISRRNLYALYIVPDAKVKAALREVLREWGDTTRIVVDARACAGDILAVPRGHPLLEPWSVKESAKEGDDGHS